MKRTALLALVLTGCTAGGRRPPASSAASSTAVADENAFVELHGQRVPDPFRALEDVSAPATTSWRAAQEERLASFLADVPGRTELKRRLAELSRFRVDSPPLAAGERLFFTRREPGETSGSLYALDGSTAPPRLLLDLRSAGTDRRIAMLAPRPDGAAVLVGTTRGKSRWIELALLDVASGRLGDPVARTHTLGGAPAWRRDGLGFYFVKYPEPAPGQEATAPVSEPRLAFREASTGREEVVYVPEKKVTLAAATSPDGRWLVVSETPADAPGNRLLVADLSRPGLRFDTLEMGGAAVTWLGNHGSTGFLFTNAGAPRGRIVRAELGAAAASPWVDVVPEGREAIAGGSAVGGNVVGYFGGRFVAAYLKDGTQVLRVFSESGAFERELPLPKAGAVWALAGSSDRKELYFQTLALADPGTVHVLDVETMSVVPFFLASSPIRPDEIEVEHVFVTSGDGTRVPMFVAHRRGLAKDGGRPAYVYGYGAFGWVSFIWYQPKVLAWLEMGGVYAQPSIRGGGEYGEEWHRAGTGANRINGLRDFEASLDWLVASGWTSRSRLVVNGGSASAPLAANVLLDRPNGAGAVVIDRPILDLLRFDRFTQGAYWAGELGSPQKAEDFALLRAWSPYHNIRAGTCYAPTLVVSGDRDQTAVPSHAYKFTAALQRGQGCANPVLLKVVHGADHNYGVVPEEAADAYGDELAFLTRVLGSALTGVKTPSQPTP